MSRCKRPRGCAADASARFSNVREPELLEDDLGAQIEDPMESEWDDDFVPVPVFTPRSSFNRVYMVGQPHQLSREGSSV